MTISETSIANRALQKLGAKRIEDLSQDNPNARSLNAAYDLVRDAELTRYDWGFAIARASIAADASDTLWGDWKRYTVPNDFLRLMLNDESGAAVDWHIEGLFIVTTDAAPLDVKYVARIEDPTYYNPLFIEALACKLALECCEEITQSTSKKQVLQADYNYAINEAKRIGAIEKPAQELPEDSWIIARN